MVVDEEEAVGRRSWKGSSGTPASRVLAKNALDEFWAKVNEAGPAVLGGGANVEGSVERCEGAEVNGGFHP